MAETPPLVEVGFWCRAGGDAPTDDRPDPRALVDPAWLPSPQGAAVAAYVDRAGYVESYEHGYSTCRFAGCTAPRRELGCASLTDGTYVWPEGLSHYLRAHAVVPPPAFVGHVLRQWDAWRAAGGGGDGDGDGATRHHLLWDAEARAPVPLPRGTADYLRAHSTLVIAVGTGPRAAAGPGRGAAAAAAQAYDARPTRP